MTWFHNTIKKLLGIPSKGPAKVLETYRGEPITWKKPESAPQPQVEASMQTNKDGTDLIMHFEGFRAKPYLCSAGVATIGYGSTFYEDGTKVTIKDAPIAEPRAAALFGNVLRDFEKQVLAFLPKAAKLSDNQFSGLMAFAYNLGPAALKQSTLLKLALAGDYAGAAEQFARWDKAGGKALKGLTVRRHAERALFLGLDWRDAEAKKRKELGV